MQTDWLKNRLVPSKSKSPLWAGFADAVQSMLESAVLPLIKRSANRKSIMTMEPEDLDTRVKELGRFFYISEAGEASLPMLLQQRLDEIHFKGTDRPIKSTLWREFKNINVTWEPLYAPVDQAKYPYGSIFVMKSELDAARQKYGEFFLTSRGRLNVALNELYDAYASDSPDAIIREFLKQFRMVVEPLIPLTIVFDGMGYYLSFDMSERQIIVTVTGLTAGITPGTWTMPRQKALATLFDIKTEDKADYVAEQLRRPLRAPDLRFDEMRIDAWTLDAIAEPVISPGGQPDARLTVADGVVTLQARGAKGCINEYQDGKTETFSFSGEQESVVLPISESKLNTLKKLTYLFS